MPILDADGNDPEQGFYTKVLRHWLRQTLVQRVLERVGRMPPEQTLRRLYHSDRRQQLGPTETAELLAKVLSTKPARKVIAQIVHANAVKNPISYRAAMAQLFELYREVEPLARAARSGLLVAGEMSKDPRGEGAGSVPGGAVPSLDTPRAERANSPLKR